MYTGIDIGGTKCAVLLAGSDGAVQKRIQFPTTSVQETLDAIFDGIKELGCGDAIGISCGGPLDSKQGVILSPPNLPGWDAIPIVSMLEKEFHVPAAIQNDANACALAEWNFGAGKGTRNMIFLTFGTGMGAGLILDGKLYSGTNDMAGEVGHIRMSDLGPVGYGKAGSFEGFCSGGGIAKLAQTVATEALQMGRPVSFCPTIEQLPLISAESVAEWAYQGDADALHVYDLCAEKLGVGLSIFIDILNPECIVLGSIFQRSEHLLRKKMEAVIQRETLSLSRQVCRIVPAALGDTIGDVAAISVAILAQQGGNNND